MQTFVLFYLYNSFPNFYVQIHLFELVNVLYAIVDNHLPEVIAPIHQHQPVVGSIILQTFFSKDRYIS